ncbi:alpha/beta hydrolase [Methylobacillus flagellatus]|uniref:Carboxylesterase n=1 Tax=Methylobacillus flagellatus (strain ATCC 51484 / DSM 6875 / VKM B-1610 / KT) TaxID=265072 RepID=Q1GZE0_METFK|nr:alpha/beta fold hydrolase [Methylobacillus flagellatus]ABE50397.1 Carboxylesterase [Methylobacillus flagellatus KT]
MSLLDCIEISPDDTIRNSVIWLHGLGADGNDFAPVARELALPHTRFILPHAPAIPVTVNHGYVMPAWYDIYSFEPGAPQDGDGIRASQQAVQALIANELARGIPSHHIMLAGFSQGGAIALHTALRYPAPLAGVLALSTYLALADSLAMENHAANQHTPIFMAHGTVDNVIPLARYQASAQALQLQGYSLELHEYPMPHSVCMEEIDDIRSFMLRQFGLSLT